jgi:hypothetical protein
MFEHFTVLYPTAKVQNLTGIVFKGEKLKFLLSALLATWSTRIKKIACKRHLLISLGTKSGKSEYSRHLLITFVLRRSTKILASIFRDFFH